jgi:esterase/lipase/carbon monoxide dehydrogenase subunit G
MIEINETFTVPAKPEDVYAVLSDPHAVVECVPGAEVGQTHEDGTFDITMLVKFSALRIRFAGRVGLELDEAERRGTMTASGKDAQGGTRFQVTAGFLVVPGADPGTSEVSTTGEVQLRGKLASVIEGAAGAVVKRMTGEFIEALSLRCASESTVLPAADAAADGVGTPTETGGTSTAAVLLLHGFGSSPGPLRAWGEALAGRGIAVALPRLAGHGTRWKDLNQTRWTDWYAGAERALSDLRQKHDTVVVMGISLGATLALRLAELHPADVAGVVAVNPVAAGLHGVTRWSRVRGRVFGSKRAPSSDVNQAGARDGAYDRIALRAADSLLRTAPEVVADLGKISCPVLLGSSLVDHVVPTSDGDLVWEALPASGRERMVFERSYHIVPLDYDAEALTTRSVEFVDQVVAAGRV